MTDGETIIRIAARGDGVTASGRHVAGAAPGDRLDPAGGLIPGPHHREPPCRHFADCGGCQLQHVDDSALAEFVTDRVVGPLIGKSISIATVHPPHLSPPQSRRRATVHFARDRQRFRFGFHAPASHSIVNTPDCHILHPNLVTAMNALRPLLSKWEGKTLFGKVELTLADQGVDMLVEGLAPDDLAAHERLVDFARDHGLARLAVDRGDGPETQWEPEPVTISFGDVAVPMPFGAFLQSTADGEAALVAAARKAMGNGAMVADLFSGLGSFAFQIGAAGRKVYAAEAARDSLMALKQAANRLQLPVFADHRDLFRNPLRPDMLDKFDAVLLDPPRAGAQDQVAQLARSAVPVICYVSCNPATLARDALALVEAGYRLTDLWPVGQFRWSSHVELVSRFAR